MPSDDHSLIPAKRTELVQREKSGEAITDKGRMALERRKGARIIQ